MSLPIITLTSNSKNFREPSFSSYLNGAEETFVLKLRGKTTRALDSSISIPQDRVFLGKNRMEDAELEVFDAEKYFNDGLNHSPDIATKSSPSHQMKKDDPSEIFASTKQHQITTPSIHSESSLNSWSALLTAVSRNQKPRRTNKKSFLASIGFSCSCTDKNSVNVDVFNGESCSSKSTNRKNAKSRQRDKNSNHLVSNGHLDFDRVKFDERKVRTSEGHFSLPVFNSRTGNQADITQENDATKQKPGEIFGSKFLENGKNCLTLEKKLTFLTWDAIAPGTAKIPSISCKIDEDSDSSSDLFEIESLSKGSIQASDSISGCITPTACYAPSEASIEWSVITSDANYDFLSDSYELSSTNMAMPQPPEVGRSTMPKRSRILSGCKSQKVVRVVEDALYDTRRRRSESLTPMSRF